MKSILPLAVAATILCGASGAAWASAQLAESKQCMQCHAVDHKVIGPSFQSIGATYRGMKNPVPKLMAVIHDGSSAYLGPLSGAARMPDESERPKVSEAEARQLAQWILRLR